MAKKRKRRIHKVNPKTPLWKIHRILADLHPHKQKELVQKIVERQHPDAKTLGIEFLRSSS